MLVQPVALNQEALDSLARHRVQVQSTSSTTIKLPRKRRTCRKCALLTCPGSQRVNNCQNPCRDCKKVDCVTKGRNPKKLEEPCWKGWHTDLR
jgi:recombinational DNA repair protein RecR